MRNELFRAAAAAAVLQLTAAPALAQSAPLAQPATSSLPVRSAELPTSSAVGAFYSTWRARPMWFQGAAAKPAAAQLAAILRRAQYDGLASGPQLAAQVEAAVAQATGGNPATVMAAEQMLSSAWVLYVQSLKRPTPRMIYAYPVLGPQGTRADQILLTATAAPSLERHLQTVSGVNPIYAQLRDTAWSQAQAALGASPDPRLLANLERARALPAGGRYVLVDAATQRLWMYENGQAVDSMKVIVGMRDLPTPLIASIMHYVTLNPYWNVPHHLVRKTIAPNVQKQGLSYLKTRGYEVMDRWTDDAAVVPADQIDWKAVQAGKIQIRVRQKPSAANSMGKMKFPFPSGEDIYLHDTPSKALFAKDSRALSNGCVRLEDAPRLARWLLGRDPIAPSSDPEIRVQLPQGVPIYLTYLTAQPTAAGVTYLSDVYGWDGMPGTMIAAQK